MNEVQIPYAPDQIGRTMQIVVVALVMGLAMFGAIAYSVGHDKPVELGIISCLGVAVFLMNVLVSFILSRTATARNVRQIAAQNPENWRQQLAAAYSSKVLLADAPLEAAGFFNGVAYIIEGHWMSLALMITAAALMAVTFPSQAQFETWAEQVQRESSA